jgi:glyoxylase-like metal-dependent hydrolase (beta-lactamase superfamily II)
MKRATLSVLVGSAALAMMAVTAVAQAPDFSKVQIKTNKVTDNFYTLDGNGGTIGVLTGPDGVFMVDTQFAPLSEKIAAAIKAISDKPIKYVVNTHVHGDHTGGDENFGKMGAAIIAREQLRRRLMYPNPLANGQPAPAMPAAGLPSILYNGELVMQMDGETIHMIAIPAAHTDGDTIVWFENANVIMTGDFYRSIQYPNIDRANGGSLNGMINGLGRVVGLAGPNTKIIPGHGPNVTREAVMEHRDILIATRDKVKALIAQGKSEDEAVAAAPTADTDSKIKEIGMTRDRFVRQVYQELKANR